MATIVVQVGASTDDARNINGALSKQTAAATMHLGMFNATDRYWNGFIFPNVTIPIGATITSAVLDLYSAGTGTGTLAKTIWYGVLESSPVTFNTTTVYPEGKPRTTASVTKDYNPALWTATGFGIETVDVAACVQEVVNQGGWASGNRLGLIGYDNGSASTNFIGHNTFDSLSSRAATLTITYTTGAPATTLGSQSTAMHPGAGVNNFGRFMQRAPAFGGQVPTAPSAFTLTADNEYRTVMSWTDNSAAPYAATNWIVERGTDGINYTPIGNTPPAQNWYIDLTCSPLTQYYYRVKARNSYGDSAYATPASVVTPDIGQPWSAKIQGWIYPGALYSPKTEYADGRDIYTLKPEYATVTAGGVIQQSNDPAVGADAYNAVNADSIKRYSQQQYFTCSANATGFSALMASGTNQTNGITTLLSVCQQAGFTGVELDWEGYGSWSAPNYAQYKVFLANLVSTFTANGLKVLVVGPPIADVTSYTDLKQSFYQFKYEEIALIVDGVVALLYDYQYDFGAGSPVQPLQWAQDVCNFLLRKIGWANRNKIIVGMPGYGYHGATGGFTLTIDPYQTSVGLPGFSTATRDAASQELTWTNGGNSYFASDVTTLNAKRKALEDMGMQWVSFWHLGGNLWFNGRVEPVRASKAIFYPMRPPTPGLGTVNPVRFKQSARSTALNANVITTRNQTGIARIQVSTARTQTGVARITLVTNRTQTGVARITATTTRTQTGIARITVTTPRTQTGISRITATTARTQTGKAAIKQTTTKTQTGIARITATTTRAQTGVARIGLVTTRTQTGISRITLVVPRTQTGIARITATTARTQTGKARITVSTTRTQTGVATIITGAARAQTGVARITATTTKTQTGKAAIKVTTARTQTGISRITATTPRTQTGISRITAVTARTQTGKAAIRQTTARTQTGVARIALVTPRTQTGVARIQLITSRTQTGISRVTQIVSRTQTGIAKITGGTQRNQTGVARITAVTVRTQLGKAAIALLASRTQTGKARITLTTARTQTGKAAIRFTTQQNQTGKASLANLTLRTQTGVARIVYGIDVREKPMGFVDTPIVGGAVFDTEKPQIADSRQTEVGGF